VVLLAGVVLFLLPEPVTSAVGAVLIVPGVVGWALKVFPNDSPRQ